MAIPMALGKVRPNGLYGFRTEKTMGNPVIWYKANAFAGKALLLSGIFMTILAASLPLAARRMHLGDNAINALGVVIELAPVIGAAMVSFIYLAKLK
jgi:uncharacterized membrane protein